MGSETRMKIDFPGIEAFVTVARSGSFTTAADQLNLSQTAISHRIRKLEESLGARLIVRSTRRVALSDAGGELYPRMSALLEQAHAELVRVQMRQQESKPVVTVACLPTIAACLLPGAVQQFSAQQPGVRVAIIDTAAVEIGKIVASGAAGIGLTIMAAGSAELPMTILMSEEYCLVTPAAHPLARRDSATWDDLRGEKLIRVNAQTANRFIMDQTLGSRSEVHDWAYEVQHTLTAVRLVAQGLGLAIIPRSAFDAFNGPGIAAVPINRPRVTRKLGIMTAGGRRLSAAEQSFVGVLQARARAQQRRPAKAGRTTADA